MNFANEKLESLQKEKENLQNFLNDKTEHLEDTQAQNTLLKSALDNKELINLRLNEESKKLNAENNHLEETIQELEKDVNEVKF